MRSDVIFETKGPSVWRWECGLLSCPMPSPDGEQVETNQGRSRKQGRGALWASWEGWQAESMGQQQFWGSLQVQGTPEEHPCTIPLQNCPPLADHGLRCFLLTESIALTVPQDWLSFSPSLCFCSTPSTIISPFHGHSTPGASCWMGWCLPRAAGMTGEGVLLQTLTVSFWERDKKWEKHVTVS